MAEPVDPNQYSRRLVVLFAALVAALGWAGVFESDPVPFDTTSSELVLPPLTTAAIAFADPLPAPEWVPTTTQAPIVEPDESPVPDEPSMPAEPDVVEFSAAPPEPIVPEATVFDGEPDAAPDVPAPAGEVTPAEEPAEFVAAESLTPTATTVHAENFAVVDGWDLFEQIIEPRPECYGAGLAEFGRSDEGEWLELVANAAVSDRSNHPILGRRLDVDAVSGLHRLSVTTRIGVGSAAGLQVGPELSVQNTVQADSGAFLTQTFAIQYEARPGTHHWNLWSAFGEEIGWRRVNTAPLSEDEWYRISLVFDTGTGEYHELSVEGPGGFTLRFDEVTSLWQDKSFQDEAVWVTLEAENLYTCDSPRPVVATVHYDELLYERLG
jgi:hypothetical protein